MTDPPAEAALIIPAFAKPFTLYAIMKHSATLFGIFCLITYKASSQPVFKNDTSYKPQFTTELRKIDSLFDLKKNNEFELRLWAFGYRARKLQVFIVSFNGKKWKARFFEETWRRTDTLYEIKLNQDSVFKLWQALSGAGILDLQSQEDLRDKDGEELQDDVRDGTGYVFELLTQKNKRVFAYHCPKLQAEDYPLIPEFKQTVKIINLIYFFCGISLKPTC